MANVSILVGNVGADPEIKQTEHGKVATFRLATTNRITNRTTWHNIEVWGGKEKDGLAGVVERFVKKGTRVYLQGRIENDQYEKDGAKQTFSKVVADELELLSPAPDGQQQAA